MGYLAAAFVLAVLAGLLASGSPRRRALAIVVVVADALLPFAVPAASHPLRGALALSALATSLRTLDLLKRRAPVSAWRRVAHVIAMIDTFRATRAPRRLPVELFTSLSYAIPAALGLWLALSLAPNLAPSLAAHPASTTAAYGSTTAAYWTTRWTGGLLLAYASTEVVYGVVWSAYTMSGLRVPRIHRAPILARSIQEFWGQRWNINVSAWLAAHCFRPLARRGHPALGLTAAFATSAALHAYIAEAALGRRWTFVVLAYFLLQGFFALIEEPLGVKRWPRWLGHTWVVVLMIATSPLFCEPFLRVIAPP